MERKKQQIQKDFHRNLQAMGYCDWESVDLKQVYNALALAVMANLSKDWTENRNANQKRCGYFSAEFLLGRMIFSNLLNTDLLFSVKEILSEIGVKISDFEEVEDAALGNGGLGRLAACFLDSAASQNIPLDGYGLRYRYGLFKQKFEDGFQKEYGDDWLSWGDPFSIRKEKEKIRIDFADFSVYAVPYDMPVIGYRNGRINTLRLWQSEPIEKFDFFAFDKMQGEETALKNFQATSITDVLYPNDNEEKGKILRLRQQYLLVSASLQDFLNRYKKTERSLTRVYETQVFQLNDTHPVLAILEFIRLLQENKVAFEDAFLTAGKTFFFTNHTIMAEALEKWDVRLLEAVAPSVLRVLEKIQARLESEGLSGEKYYILKDGVAHMANLAVYVCEKVNGVAEIHTNILKERVFADWYALYPDKFINVTNGITPRRWIMLNNPKMAKLIAERIGVDWASDLTELEKLKAHVMDGELRKRFMEIKKENKKKLAEYILKREGVEIPEHFVFDIQIKRLHEYKRQLLNAFSIVYIYKKIKSGEMQDFPATAFIFGAKAAPGYYTAKAIIKYINEIARMINQDEDVCKKMKVVFVQNYNVSYAEKLVCAGDISEQISMAGMEASGTGNMKFMLNGTVTLGTLDGANVEICQEAGKENNYIFGASVEEIDGIKQNYKPLEFIETNPELKEVVETLIDGTFSDDGAGLFRAIYNSLLAGKDADKYLVLYDFSDYIEKKLACIYECGKESFITKSLLNMASAGKFSSDRSVREYADKIWGL